MRKNLTSLILIFVLLLSACGNNGTQGEGSPDGNQTEGQDAEVQADSEASEELHWRLLETPLPDGDEAIEELDGGSTGEYLYGLWGDTVYRASASGGKMYLQTMEPPYTEWQTDSVDKTEWVADRTCFAQYVTLCGPELKMLLSGSGEDTETEEWYRAKWNPQDGLDVEPVVSGELNQEFLSHTTLYYTARDGASYYVSTAEGVVYFDSDFQEKTVWLDTGHVWQFLENEADGKLYFCGQAVDGGFCIWTPDSHEPCFQSDEVTMSLTGTVVFSGPTEGYLCVPEGVWQFDLASGEMEKQTDFAKEGYSVKRIYGAQINEAGNLLLAVSTFDQPHALLEREVDENWASKKELVLAASSAGPLLNRAVADFNRQSQEYYVTLREMGEEDNWQDYRTRIQVEMSGGKGPDLLVGDIVNLTDAAGKGLLRPLGEDLSAEKERMLENVRASGEVKGELYAVPYAFYMETLVVSSDVAGERESWTPEEFMECVRNLGAEEAAVRLDETSLFWILTSYSDIIDWENGQSRFDSDQAVERLEFAKEYGAKVYGFEESGPRLREGKVVAYNPILSDLGSTSAGKRCEVIFEGKEVYIGFPVSDYPEQNGGRILCQTLVVNQACRNPEGAVAFLRYLISEEVQKEIGRWSIALENMNYLPVDAQALENAFGYAAEIRENPNEFPAVESEGITYMPGPCSEESLKKQYRALVSAQANTPEIYDVANIVSEEAPAYFSGDKTAKEVCDTIQNRVQLYLDETH